MGEFEHYSVHGIMYECPRWSYYSEPLHLIKKFMTLAIKSMAIVRMIYFVFFYNSTHNNTNKRFMVNLHFWQENCLLTSSLLKGKEKKNENKEIKFKQRNHR